MIRFGGRMIFFTMIMAVFFVSPSPSPGQDCRAYIGEGGNMHNTIQAAINSVSAPYTEIRVSGTCNENLFISELKDYLSIVGPADMSANIIGGDSSKPVIQTIGRGTRIQNLNISGSLDGIQVIRGGTAFIESNNIANTGRYGIVVTMSSFAHIVNNTIQNNPAEGILAADNAHVRIGIRTGDDTVALPNVIQGNQYGITIARSSTARIIGNTISSNTYDGIRVVKVSQADISSNRIDGNGGSGIFVTQNSGVNLGRDTGEGIFDSPNDSSVNNGTYGVSCSIGGYADGRLGTLKGNGKRNTTSFTGNCIDSLIP